MGFPGAIDAESNFSVEIYYLSNHLIVLYQLQLPTLYFKYPRAIINHEDSDSSLEI